MNPTETSQQARMRTRLIAARTERGLSQNQVADRIGTTHVNVSRWERGITKPSPYFRHLLCELFNKTEEELDLVSPTSLTTLPESPLPSSAEETEHIEPHTQDLPPIPTTPPTTPTASTPIYDPAIPLLPTIPLIGREADLARIKNGLRADGTVALTALNGLPGVGKTALSITLAHDTDIRAQFKDGVLWAGLGPHPNMTGIFSHWGSLLGISETQMHDFTTEEAWATAIRAAIGPRSFLLVIDDAWDLLSALAFRVGGPHCAHLVTTRFPHIASDLTVNGAIIIRELDEENSVKLLGLLAPQAVDREAQKAHDLAQAVGGLPLALTLMGNYLRRQASSGPSRRITTALERLNNIEVRLQIDEPLVPVEIHPSLTKDNSLSLQSVIAVTDQFLNEQARAAFYALAIFPPKPQSFSEEAALAVANCTFDELDALTETGLLEITTGDRYQFHQVIADYTRYHLQRDPVALAAAQQRLLTYVSTYVETHKKDYEQLELESSTILTTLDIAHATSDTNTAHNSTDPLAGSTYSNGNPSNAGTTSNSQQSALVTIACSFAPYLLSRGQYATVETYLQYAYTAATALHDDNNTARALLYLGETAQMQGNFPLAETRLQHGLSLARHTNNKENICAFLTNLGWVARKQDEYAKAEELLQEALELARQLDNIELLYRVLNVLGPVAGNQGKYEQAKIYVEEGLKLARQLDDKEHICILLMNLGASEAQQGNLKQAEQYFRESLEIARQIGHREVVSELLANLGDIAGTQERYAQAEEYLQEGLEIARQIGHREVVSELLLNLGWLTRKQGKDHTIIKAYYQECIELARQINRPFIVAHALNEYGNLELEEVHLERAEQYFYEMINATPPGSQELIALGKFGLARVAALRHENDKARRLGKDSLTILKEIKFRDTEEVQNWLNSLV